MTDIESITLSDLLVRGTPPWDGPRPGRVDKIIISKSAIFSPMLETYNTTILGMDEYCQDMPTFVELPQRGTSHMKWDGPHGGRPKNLGHFLAVFGPPCTNDIARKIGPFTLYTKPSTTP